MTKPRLIANSANNGSIPGSRLVNEAVTDSKVSAGISSSKSAFAQSAAGAVVRTAQAKLSETVSVEDFGAVGDGVTDDTQAFNSAFASGARYFRLLNDKTYKIGDVTLPSGSNWSIDGSGATITPSAGASACFAGVYSTQIFNTSITDLSVTGSVTDVIRFNLEGSGVLLNCKVSSIRSTSGTCESLLTINTPTTTAQGETLQVKDITILGADYDYVVRVLGPAPGYGSCAFENIFHNGNAGVATIYAERAFFLSKFDTVYHTRGSGVKCGPGAQFTHCWFSRMETESVEHGTILYDGDFSNCSFNVSAIYNQLLTAPFSELIGSGVFKNCSFSNNFTFQRTGPSLVLDAGSTRNSIFDFQVGALEYVDYGGVADFGTFNTFFGEQYSPAPATTVGAIAVLASYEAVKQGRVVSLKLPQVLGPAASLPSFEFSQPLPEKYRPSGTQSFVVAAVTSNNAPRSTPGAIEIGSSGSIRVYLSPDMTTPFSPGATGGLNSSVTVTYLV